MEENIIRYCIDCVNAHCSKMNSTFPAVCPTTSEDNSEMIYGGIQNEALEGIKFLADLYKNDYIDKEFVTKDCNDLVEDVANGKVGLVFAPYWMIENALHTGWTRNKLNSAFTDSECL